MIHKKHWQIRDLPLSNTTQNNVASSSKKQFDSTLCEFVPVSPIVVLPYARTVGEVASDYSPIVCRNFEYSIQALLKRALLLETKT